MNTQNLVDRARRLAYVDSSQYTDTQAVEDLNIIYHDIENTIVSEVREDFFWDYFNTDSVIGQEEYRLPEGLTGDFTSLYKSIGVSIKYRNTDTEFYKARRVYPYQLPNDIEWYKKHQSITDPIYHISDKSVFIYPTPTEVIGDGIKIYGIKNLRDLTITDTATDIFSGAIPTKFYHTISLGMLEYIYQSRGMINEAIQARNRYEAERQKLVSFLKQRDIGVMQIIAPNLSNFY